MLPALIPLLLLFLSLFACKDDPTAPVEQEPGPFQAIPISKPVQPLILESSGMADSKKHPGHLWVHEDSGTPPQLILLSHEGTVKKSIYLKWATNRDWEEMQRSGDQLYIADIGDNRQVHKRYSIYQFTEPDAAQDTISDYRVIHFEYPDGSHDAEAFLVDPDTKDLYLITKRDEPSRIYKISQPFSPGHLHTATYVANLAFSGVVGAALSPDGREILIKTYLGISLYNRSAGQSLADALQNQPKIIAYQIEPQGEALCFAEDNKGFFTLSEIGFGSTVNLNFYPRR